MSTRRTEGRDYGTGVESAGRRLSFCTAFIGQMIGSEQTVARPVNDLGGNGGLPNPAASTHRSAGRRETGAVVLGGDYQGLGIVRNLGFNGVPAFVLDDERSIARFSRYACGSARIGDMGTGESFVDELIRLGSRHRLDGWVLYPTRDETVAAIARNRDRLAERFRVATPPWESVQWAWDKRNTYRLAARVDVPAPRTWTPADRAELAAIDAEPPLVIKPAIKENFFYATKAKAWRADSLAELATLFDQALSLVPGEVMIQELIPGGGAEQYGYVALYRAGRPVASMVVRRLRQHPPEFGRASTFVETIEAPTVEALSERLLGEIAYDGLVELEYKRDPRDQTLKLLDFNARTCGYHSLGSAAGVDFPYLLFRQQLGLPVGQRIPRLGTRWVRLLTDVPTAAIEIAAGRLDIRAYLSSLRSARTEAVFSWRDPAPGLAELALVPYLALRRGL